MTSLYITIYHYVSLSSDYTIENHYENLLRRGGAGFPMAEERHPTARPGHEANQTWQSPNTWRFQWENHGKIMGKYGKIMGNSWEIHRKSIIYGGFSNEH